LIHLGDRWDEVYPGIGRKSASGERMTATVYDFGPARKFPLHEHDEEQIVFVVEGEIRFSSATSSETVAPGTLLIIPPDLPHDAVAGPNGARVFRVVSPARAGGTALRVLRGSRALAPAKGKAPAKKPRSRT
jgi:quercetin dioxygenase-like cupin family protein